MNCDIAVYRLLKIWISLCISSHQTWPSSIRYSPTLVNLTRLV